MLRLHLRQAEEHIPLGRKHVAVQTRIVEDLESAGQNSDTARLLLRTFEDLLGAHEQDGARLRGELASAE
jgi:hypothetical protein